MKTIKTSIGRHRSAQSISLEILPPLDRISPDKDRISSDSDRIIRSPKTALTRVISETYDFFIANRTRKIQWSHSAFPPYDIYDFTSRSRSVAGMRPARRKVLLPVVQVAVARFL
jgi:hypothetical protein